MSGNAWKFGDDINTDLLAPGIHIKKPIDVLARHCLEDVHPSFSSGVKKGDYIVGGKNFGMGSSREQAAQVLIELGVAAVIAPSFGGIFYRNAFNLGLPAIICQSLDQIQEGDQLHVELGNGVITNKSSEKNIPCEPVPENLLVLINVGGLVPYLELHLAQNG